MSAGALRVAFQSPCWPFDLIPNGIATYVKNIRGALGTLGVETRVLASQVAAGLADPDVVPVATEAEAASAPRRLLERVAYRASVNAWSFLRFGRAVGEAARALDQRWPIDLLEMEESFGAAALVARALPGRVVVRLHGPWTVVGPALGAPRDHNHFARVGAEGLALRAAVAVSSPSRAALDHVRRAYRLPLEGAAVIPNPVTLPAPALTWRPDSCEPDTLLFLGRFDRVKGADLVLDAFARLLAEFPRLELLFAGPDVGLRDGTRTWKLAEYLEARLPAPARARVQVLGAVDHGKVVALRRQAFVTVVASRFETFPMVVLEALAAGSPLVTADCGGVPEIVRHGETALTFPAGDAAALAAQVAALLRERPLAARLGAAGREDCARRFVPQVVAARMRDFYAGVLDASKRGR